MMIAGLPRLCALIGAICAALTPGLPAAARAEAPPDRAMGAVLTVRSADAADRFLGSAFLWAGGEGLALTNAHVVGAAERVRLTDATGAEEIGQVLVRDSVRDVAVIAVRPGRAGLEAGPAPAPGTEVWALGAPLGIEFTLTRGVVSALDRQVEPQVPLRLLQHDAAVNPGSSGGPLVDGAGRLVGMNSRIADGSRMYVGIAYAIPAADLERIARGLLAGRLPAVAQLGMQARPIDRQLAAALNVPPGGVLVDAVAAEGLAARAGIRPGDAILAVDGTTPGRPGDLAFLIEAAQDAVLPGEGGPVAGALAAGSARLTLWRDGRTIELTLNLTPVAVPPTPKAPVQGERHSLASLGIGLDDGGRVADLPDASAAWRAGVAAGDRILALNGRALEPAEMRAAVLSGPVLLLLAARDGRTRHVLIDPGDTDGGPRPVGGANVLDPDVVVF